MVAATNPRRNCRIRISVALAVTFFLAAAASPALAQEPGEFLGVFASGGGLADPENIAFGPDGSLYVASQATDQVLRYNGVTGEFREVAASGGGLDEPRGITFGPDGDLFVSSYETHEILRFKGFPPPVTIEVGIEKLMGQVRELVVPVAMNGGQIDALIAHLERARRAVARGNLRGAVAALQAFVEEVDAFVGARTLSEENGQILIEAAEGLIVEIEERG